jgi:hypothetical protein
MSTLKLFGRISNQIVHDRNKGGEAESELSQSISHCLTFDPLIKFGCVLAALIHDADHQGLPNSQLVKKQSPLVNRYGNQSTAEQHSVNVGWNLFMDSTLLDCVCPTEADAQLLRQIVVNCVLATDIVDRNLAALRNARWNTAFETTMEMDSSRLAPQKFHTTISPATTNHVIEDANRKATIVLELLIQASDVSHTMQHWHVYCKWNECLFREMYEAHLNGHSDCDPSKVWYEAEIGFFENYIIPLATKLRDSGCYGVSGDEFLSYARSNLEEWRIRGQEVVADMREKSKR